MISSQKQFKRLSHMTEGLYEPSERETAQMKKVLLMIYKDVFSACEQNGITLMMCGGTALGAVRHGGFIPWDDDVDLLLTREDYEKFKQIFHKALGDKYVLQVPNADGCEISNLYMKVILKGTERKELLKLKAPGLHGLWVDIFPLDYAPDNKLLQRIKGFFSDAFAYTAVSNYMRTHDTPEIRKYMSATLSSRINHMIRMTLGFLTGFLSYKTMYNLFDRFVQSKKPTNTVTAPTGIRHYMGEMHPKAHFIPAKEAAFEGERGYLPADVHSYLTQLYGDYMTPPPVNKRERHFYVSLDLGPYPEDEHEAD
ncbi:MAG: LicD family protein [Clostridia bacterium]|nr:LicD family protein [Clostridia bacterium]